ncbi:MAG: hypothetical protein CMH83_18855 [Nocardioides sp.]|nr:hypothetical protein [Nocardioides sp.]
MSEITIVWQNLDNLLTSMGQIRGQAVEIDDYVSTSVCSTAGFDYEACVLRPIADQLGTVAGYFTDVRELFERRWEGVQASLVTTGKAHDRTDNEVSINWAKATGGSYGPYAPSTLPDVDIEVELFPLQPVTPKLSPPDDGESQLKHPEEFDWAAGAYDDARDTINEGIAKLNTLPQIHITPLSSKSLRDYIVFPLSGNYLKIGANANAATHTKDGMLVFAENFVRMSGKTTAAVDGRAGGALALHIGLYGAVMGAVGVAVQAGGTVFNDIAKVSERIAVAVETAMVKMLKILTRVAKKIITKVLSWVGWLSLAIEVAERGWAAITDIWDDIVAAKDIIETCWDLKEKIEAWAERCAERLDTFKEIVDLVRELPQARGEGGLENLPHVQETVFENDLAQIDVDFGDDPGPGEDLEEDLDDLSADDGGDVDDDTDDYEEGDDLIMAPGPIEPPLYVGEDGTVTGGDSTYSGGIV